MDVTSITRISKKLVSLAVEYLPAFLLACGTVAGGLLAAAHLKDPYSPTALWMKAATGWEFDAFAAFGTMSGFSLAALALIASLNGHERASRILDASPGRFLVRCLMHATVLWFLPATLALLVLFTGAVLAEAVMLWAACVASASGAVALVALGLFFRRFGMPKSD